MNAKNNVLANQSAFDKFITQISTVLSSENIISRYIQRFAYGTDASFYRLVPKVVLRIDNEQELVVVLKFASQYQLPVTFRAAGTSLSGQAITDSILIVLSSKWNNITIFNNGEQVALQPGVIGAQANKALASYSRKIGPDPASINSCKIGGIAANNASGMCCGVKDNSYHTLAAIKVVFADGSALDTSNSDSCQQFLAVQKDFIAEFMSLVNDVKADIELVDKISHKYRLKNTTGYGLNALIDYQDPIDIISHLMIGSEGTLAFISEITYNTVAILPFKATGLYIIDDMQVACELVHELSHLAVDAVEIMDSRALNSVLDKLHLIEEIHGELSDFSNSKDTQNYTPLPNKCAGLLIEFSATSEQALAQQQALLAQVLVSVDNNLIAKQTFTQNTDIMSALWGIRKGMFPAVGAVRAKGTTVVIEDIALPLNKLAEGVEQLHLLFSQFGYDEAIIFGHALAGNLHFVFTQTFDSEKEINRYHNFMAAVAQLVAVKYQGSLKAEHGTGRNMAPFVEMEWGTKLYCVMQRLKKLFDPKGILNPGVIINDDKKAHIKHLKTMAKADDLIDTCIECGFCESVCPSQNLTLTPRQRIAVWRQIAFLQNKAKSKAPNNGLTSEEKLQLSVLSYDYQYFGIDSCAATGLCGQQCPVGIDTGLFIKGLRGEHAEKSQFTHKVATGLAGHFSVLTATAKLGLNAISTMEKVLGTKSTANTFSVINKITSNVIPKWYPAWPAGAKPLSYVDSMQTKQAADSPVKKVVYIPSCANRIFAADSKAQDQRALPEVIASLLAKAGFELIIPQQSKQLCCGMPWQSKGLTAIAQEKRQAFIEVINTVSEQGKWPVLTDASPCALTINSDEKGMIYESAEFMVKYVLPKLTITKTDETFMLHTTCSSKKMDDGIYLKQLALACSDHIVEPENIHCCGFAGDKGFYLPELNKAALAPLKAQIPSGCTQGLSNSRTCEIGLSEQSQISYQSILYLLDRLSE